MTTNYAYDFDLEDDAFEVVVPDPTYTVIAHPIDDFEPSIPCIYGSDTYDYATSRAEVFNAEPDEGYSSYTVETYPYQ